MVQAKKMNTPRELYLQCLDEELQKITIPRIGYAFSMDARKKAAQATIDFYAKPNVKLLSKKSHGLYSDSDTSSCEEQYVSNSNLPSSTSLKIFI